MTTSAVARFLDRFTEWAMGQTPIQAAALVGSHARGTATAASDIDLVILADEPGQFLTERAWVRTFGEPIVETLEDYGLLKAIRVRYRDDLEVEFGIAGVQWPLDSGSLQVINDGVQVLFERRPLLADRSDMAARHPNEPMPDSSCDGVAESRGSFGSLMTSQ